MGTRAQFFIGDPMDIESREYLGCVAWDGYPNGDCGDALRAAASPEEFRAGVSKIEATRDDFSNPDKRAWPFPWKDNLFLTDVTFAFFNGCAQATLFHAGFRPLEFFYSDDGGDYGDGHKDELPENVPAPTSDKPRGTDSIMIITAR